MIYVTILVLAFVQNLSFTLASRSRNRDNMTYTAICAVFSNGLWFLTMHYLVVADLNFWLAIPYIIGTVGGTIFGAKISIYIEKLIGAET